MPTIKVHRPKKFIGFARSFNVYVDDKKIGSLANGATEEFELPAGNHKLYCKQDMFNIPFVYDFTLAEGGTKTLTASYTRQGMFLIFFFIGIAVSVAASQLLPELLGLNHNFWLVFYIVFVLLLLVIMRSSKLFVINIWEN